MVNERADNRPDILIPKTELYPPRELVVAHSLRAVQAAAISAHNNIFILVGSEPEQSNLLPEEKFRREEIIDNSATRDFITVLRSAPFQFIGIDAEGAKEAQEGKAGIAMDLAIGTYGSGEKMVCFVVDVVEGTTAATHGRPNAWSIMAVAPVCGITPIPEDSGKKINYFQKLFAPAAFEKFISIDRPTTDNLRSITRAAQIRPADITVAIMDPKTRPANVTMVQKAQKFGAKVETYSAGDFAWSLKAINSNPEKPIIVMGRGGAEEGSIAAVAARAIGATCQLRYISHANKASDLETLNGGRKIWSANDFVPAQPEHCLVLGSAITKNDHFDMDPTRKKPSDYIVQTLVVDKSGFNIQTDEVAA